MSCVNFPFHGCTVGWLLFSKHLEISNRKYETFKSFTILLKFSAFDLYMTENNLSNFNLRSIENGKSTD